MSSLDDLAKQLTTDGNQTSGLNDTEERMYKEFTDINRYEEFRDKKGRKHTKKKIDVEGRTRIPNTRMMSVAVMFSDFMDKRFPSPKGEKRKGGTFLRDYINIFKVEQISEGSGKSREEIVQMKTLTNEKEEGKMLEKIKNELGQK